VNTRALDDGQTQLGASFALARPVDRERLLAFLFVSAPRLQRRHRVGHGHPVAFGAGDATAPNVLGAR